MAVKLITYKQANKEYGLSRKKLFRLMVEHGFRPYNKDGFKMGKTAKGADIDRLSNSAKAILKRLEDNYRDYDFSVDVSSSEFDVDKHQKCLEHRASLETALKEKEEALLYGYTGFKYDGAELTKAMNAYSEGPKDSSPIKEKIRYVDVDGKERQELGRLREYERKFNSILDATIFAMRYLKEGRGNRITKNNFIDVLRKEYGETLPDSAYEQIRTAIRDHCPGEYFKESGRPKKA